jgi:hypothetical protein
MVDEHALIFEHEPWMNSPFAEVLGNLGKTWFVQAM